MLKRQSAPERKPQANKKKRPVHEYLNEDLDDMSDKDPSLNRRHSKREKKQKIPQDFGYVEPSNAKAKGPKEIK